MTATYSAALGRVQLVVTGLPVGAGQTAIVDRFDTPALTNGVIVRGGDGVPAPSGGSLTINDYEFEPNVLLTYRTRTYSSLGVLVQTQTTTVTAALDRVWLKSPARPFLNRQVTVLDFSEVSSPARGGVVNVVGRRLPVAITEVRGSRNYELVLRAASREEADALELFLSFGDVVLVQVPADCVVPRSMYAFVADTTIGRRGAVKGAVREVHLPLTEVAAPDPSIVGYTVTWLGVVTAWASWGALLADPDVPTWLALQSYVSAPSDEIVG